jgi:hypothetical protein
MKRVIVAVASTFVFGCSANPAAPSTAYQPKHHNIPATFAGHPEGPIIYLCATQPRQYEGHMEEDHYLQYSPCPSEPIK